MATIIATHKSKSRTKSFIPFGIFVARVPNYFIPSFCRRNTYLRGYKRHPLLSRFLYFSTFAIGFNNPNSDKHYLMLINFDVDM